MQGYVQVYWGMDDAAATITLGLSLRAAGAGLRVFLGRFSLPVEPDDAGALDRFSDRITVRHYEPAGSAGDFGRHPMDSPGGGIPEEIRITLADGLYSVVILEGINTAAAEGRIETSALLDLIDLRPPPVELVLTGRHAGPELIAAADLATRLDRINPLEKDL